MQLSLPMVGVIMFSSKNLRKIIADISENFACNLGPPEISETTKPRPQLQVFKLLRPVGYL